MIVKYEGGSLWPEGGAFHAADGLFFTRRPSGGVAAPCARRAARVEGQAPTFEVAFTPEQWASVVASMQAAGETRATVAGGARSAAGHPGAMIFRAVRDWRTRESIISPLTVDGEPCGFVLEPVGEEIPTGRYPYRLTVSGRAQRGTLWTPLAEWFPAHPDRWLLPELLDVPGRTAVRSHSGNRAADSDGCLLHGTTRVPDAVVGSRPMLTRVVGLLLWCQAVGEPAWFEVEG